MVKNPADDAGGMRRRFSPWVEEFSGGGHDGPFQYSCLEKSLDRGAWWATVHGATKSDPTEATACRPTEQLSMLILY